MADNHFSFKQCLTSIFSLSFLILTGCQTDNSSMVGQLPSPNFSGPVAAAPAPRFQPNYVPKSVITNKAVQSSALRPPVRVSPSVPREWIPNMAARSWQSIVIHHSATPVGGAVRFDREHKEKGWDELGYDFVIGNGTDTADGQIEVGSRWTKQKVGAHAKTPDNWYNEHGIGICLVGNFDHGRPTAAQMKSMAKLVAYMMQTYRIPADRIVGHGDTKATDCPGKMLSIADVRKVARQMTVVENSDGTVQPVARSEPSRELMLDVKPR